MNRCGLETCNHDHRPTPLYPGYDGSGFPIYKDERIDMAAERLYQIVFEIASQPQFHSREEMVRRIGDTLKGLIG